MHKRTGYDWSFLTSLAEVKGRQSKPTGKQLARPFSKDVKAAKNNTIYGAHTYHTKVPPEGIIPYIEYYTEPGDVVMDPFSGSGMTGVAAQIMANKDPRSARDVILNDLGPAACHITYNHTHAVDPKALRAAFEGIKAKLNDELNAAYLTWHVASGESAVKGMTLAALEAAAGDSLSRPKKESYTFRVGRTEVRLVRALTNATIWSHSHSCPGKVGKRECGERLVLWDLAFDSKSGKMAKNIKCPECKSSFTRADFKDRAEYIPVHVEYSFQTPGTGRTVRAKRDCFAFERELIARLSQAPIKHWYPDQEVAPHREMMTMGPAKLGIRRVSDFYFRRNLRVCAMLWHHVNQVEDLRVRRALAFACTNTFWHATKMRRFNARGGSRPLTGTLYVPQISVECNVLRVLEKKIVALEDYYGLFAKNSEKVRLSNESATNLSLADNSIDYIFTDPPFGGNIFYSDCSVIWEGWLERFTDESKEIHFNRSRKPENGGKTRDQYKELIFSAFSEMHRVLKPGKWASVMFNNSDDAVLEVFRNAAVTAGFEISDVQFFDKQQKSFKGYLGRDGKQDVTNCDIVINVRKSPTTKASVEKPKVETKPAPGRAVSDEWVVGLVKDYLRALPKRIKQQPELFTEEHRTTPFLHALLTRKIFTSKRTFDGFTFDYLKRLLTRNFVQIENHWYLRSETQQSLPLSMSA